MTKSYIGTEMIIDRMNALPHHKFKRLLKELIGEKEYTLILPENSLQVGFEFLVKIAALPQEGRKVLMKMIEDVEND